MDWFYAESGRQVGPVTAEQFEKLVSVGKVTPDTLVWHDGLANWQPYRTLRPVVPTAPPSLTPPPPPGGAPPVIAGPGASCTECGYFYPTTEMLSYGDVWVCARCKPVFFQRIREGAPLAAVASTVWRSGDAVVIAAGSTFPARCLRCNGAVSGSVKRTLYWHHPWLYALLISPLIYIIVSLIVRKAAKVELPICAEDRSRWRVWVAVSWVLCLGGFVGIIVAIAMESGLLGIITLVAMFVGLFMGALKGTLANAKKIDRDYVWVRGFCREYRDLLPEFPEY